MGPWCVLGKKLSTGGENYLQGGWPGGAGFQWDSERRRDKTGNAPRRASESNGDCARGLLGTVNGVGISLGLRKIENYVIREIYTGNQ